MIREFRCNWPRSFSRTRQVDPAQTVQDSKDANRSSSMLIGCLTRAMVSKPVVAWDAISNKTGDCTSI